MVLKYLAVLNCNILVLELQEAATYPKNGWRVEKNGSLCVKELDVIEWELA